MDRKGLQVAKLGGPALCGVRGYVFYGVRGDSSLSRRNWFGVLRGWGSITPPGLASEVTAESQDGE